MIPMPSIVRQQWIRHQSRVGLVIRYLTGQSTLQVLNVLNGFYLLRWLSIDEQAKFNMAMAAQGSLVLLCDLGLGALLVGLIGKNINDKVLIGKYVNSINFYKKKLFLVCICVSLLLIFFFKKNADFIEKNWITYLLTILNIYLQSQIIYLSVLMQIRKNISNFYRTQYLISALRLFITAVLFYTNIINANLVILVITVCNLAIMFILKKITINYYTRARKIDNVFNKETLDTIIPSVPMTIFYILQGQLIILLISIYGQSKNIAEIGAISRLGQIFSLIAPINSVIIMPYIGKSDSQNLFKKLLIIFFVGIFIVMPIILLSIYFPNIFLFLIGPKFNSLSKEIFLFILSSSISFLTGMIYSFNTARKWNFWSSSFLYITAIGLLEIFLIPTFDLSQVKNVLLFNVYISASSLFINILTSIKGLLREKESKDLIINEKFESQ